MVRIEEGDNTWFLRPLFGSELRSLLASSANLLYKDKLEIEKEIEVEDAVFERCLEGMNQHHRNTMLSRGRIRTYHKPFFIQHEKGRTYQMGIVYIVRGKDD